MNDARHADALPDANQAGQADDAPGPVVHTRVDEGVLVVVLDRPKANAIDAATSRELGRVFAGFRDDPSLRVAVFTGAGDRFFSAGWDLGAAAAGEDFEADYGEGGFGGFCELPGRHKPVVCAVNGMAVGGGFEIAMAAEFVVAADHARFFLPETGLGIIPDAGVIRLPRMLPPVVANEVLYGGRRLDASEAERWGLVNKVVPAADLEEAAMELAGRIASAAPLAVEAVMAIDRATRHLPLGEAFGHLRSGDLEAYERMLGSEDAEEGPRAFAEKRNPYWQGA
ncbi:MAG: enoyl-CoA hydratase-related protein [Acidimicrobiales bacterium]|jgi:crotonobetainyl-CoA hydratase|nr:crotonobetainyl-CoA hydratase [Acidimicrobiales bacterium]MDE0893779.1 enoyl-CoA hydratase-related protein [Acidimicrobiales bacterium]HIE68428.1 crotonobetainyl-CoA hydratase [Acidimicrobiia bacterium]HIL49339.1 crotonobetainyl-CoA hydratase [Acidimicrobiia bacterium]|tara:strand:- start:160 stop:1008 length:849 start_codon:yes stop_codon:yes gene_type:complete